MAAAPPTQYAVVEAMLAPIPPKGGMRRRSRRTVQQKAAPVPRVLSHGLPCATSVPCTRYQATIPKAPGARSRSIGVESAKSLPKITPQRRGAATTVRTTRGAMTRTATRKVDEARRAASPRPARTRSGFSTIVRALGTYERASAQATATL